VAASSGSDRAPSDGRRWGAPGSHIIGIEEGDSRSGGAVACEILQTLEVVVAQEPAVIVGFQPLVQMNLVEIGGYQFFAQFVGFAA